MSIVPLLTLITKARGYSLTTGATMVAAMGFGMALASYPIGRLGDRFGRRTLLIAALVVSFACTAGITLSRHTFVMFASLLLLGGGHVTVINMSRAIVTDVTRAGERGRALSTTSIAVGIAVIVFPTIASYVYAAWGWGAIAGLVSVLLFAGLGLTLLLRERGVGHWHHVGVD
jgi:MFS family permease